MIPEPAAGIGRGLAPLLWCWQGGESSAVALAKVEGANVTRLRALGTLGFKRRRKVGRPVATYVGTSNGGTTHKVKWVDSQTTSTITMDVRLKRPISFGFGGQEDRYDSELEGEDRAREESVQLAIRFILASRMGA